MDKSAFASDKAVKQMMSDMEQMYAAAFGASFFNYLLVSLRDTHLTLWLVRGDKKTATKRLRAGNSLKSHHFSAFRAGVLVGIAIPALVEGLVKGTPPFDQCTLAAEPCAIVFQPQTREAIPAWGALLYVYGILLLPVLFALLVGVNLLVWANARINYVFIFGEQPISVSLSLSLFECISSCLKL